ncbi:MAG: hypothetical protein Q9225_001167 [Loekoesia sp. 1 TL-2023]
MSLAAVTTQVSTPSQSFEGTSMQLPLLFRIHDEDSTPSDMKSRQLVCSGSLSKPLQFLNVTNDPEVERKLTKNRRTVRSNAIKHAVQERKKAAKKSLGFAENPCVTERQSIAPTDDDGAQQYSTHSSTEASGVRSQHPFSHVLGRVHPRCLWPIGTMAARTNSSELRVISDQFQKIKKGYSIFSHLHDDADYNMDLASVVLQSPVVYHATLYVATTQNICCAWLSKSNSGARDPLLHEAFVLRFVQNAISKSAQPPEEVILATALLGIAQLIFERSQSGVTHLEGVAQMVRIRGGVQYINIPILLTLLEWYGILKLRLSSKLAYLCRIIGMRTLNISIDARYGSMLPPPSYLRPQLPCHSLDESLPPSDETDEVSFAFLAQRRMLHKEIVEMLQTLAMAVNHGYIHHSKTQAYSAMQALYTWKSVGGEGSNERIPQLDQTARSAGLLFYRLVYSGLPAKLCDIMKVMLLQTEIMRFRNTRHVFGLLYHGCTYRLCLILWSLYCGGVFARDQLRGWYIDTIRSVSGDTGKDWSRTKWILKKFLWDDEACEEPMKQLWRETLVDDENATDQGANGA